MRRRLEEADAALSLTVAAHNEHSEAVQRLAEILPWYAHNALIHYLSPRGLEQYSGGGWGTRDVTQGPVEMLLALGNTAAVRDVLLRVMSAQAPDGDWPQWFMFFDRERSLRAGSSHGDIVFWPVLALAQYLIASGDKAAAQAAFSASVRSASASTWPIQAVFQLSAYSAVSWSIRGLKEAIRTGTGREGGGSIAQFGAAT